MRVDNQDIIRTVRQLRDEENQQLNVRPWNRHRRHFHMPAWLVAIPAAAIVGFLFGIWTQEASQSDSPLTALVDTVYVKVPVPQSPQDSVIQPTPARQAPVVSAPATAKPAVRPSTPSPRPSKAVGRPVADDNIRYDLLVRN